MSDEIVPPARGRRRLFQPGQSGNRAGRRRGSRNKATLAAATLLDGDAPGLTRRAIEAALAGDMLEKVGRGNLLKVLTAGDDVEDEDEDIGDAEAIDDCDP
jgi:hypothetical protein